MTQVHYYDLMFILNDVVGKHLRFRSIKLPMTSVCYQQDFFASNIAYPFA